MKGPALRVVDDFISHAACADILEDIGAYRARHEPPLIERAERGRSLRYRVIDGNAVAIGLVELEQLYRRTGDLLSAWSGRRLVPIKNRVAGININITPPGGEYRWHYDRNSVTAILYLNEVTGGATEVYANHRILLPHCARVLQRSADTIARNRVVLALVGTKTVVTPRAGRLVVMRGDRCLHSVCPVDGAEERINLCLAYDSVGAQRDQHGALDDYLYTDGEVTGTDPNYGP